MLESLVEYAKRKGLMVESGFAAKRITWIADIALEGNLLGVNFSDAVKQRSRLFPACPDLQQPELA